MKQTIKIIFKFIQSFSPALAKYIYIQLFFISISGSKTKRDKAFLKSADSYTVRIDSKKIRIYEFGKGKPILLTHGWLGKASQFQTIALFLSKLGYKVICFDAPAHAYSTGWRTNILEWKSVFNFLKNNYGHFEFAIAHSFGALALLYSNKYLNLTNNIVSISAPPDSDFILSEYSKDLGADIRLADALIKYILKKYDFELDELSMQELIEDQQLYTLIVHDIHDKVISYKHSQKTYFNSFNSELILSENLGHNRILYDENIIQSIYSHLENRQELIRIPNDREKTKIS